MGNCRPAVPPWHQTDGAFTPPDFMMSETVRNCKFLLPTASNCSSGAWMPLVDTMSMEVCICALFYARQPYKYS